MFHRLCVILISALVRLIDFCSFPDDLQVFFVSTWILQLNLSTANIIVLLSWIMTEPKVQIHQVLIKWFRKKLACLSCKSSDGRRIDGEDDDDDGEGCMYHTINFIRYYTVGRRPPKLRTHLSVVRTVIVKQRLAEMRQRERSMPGQVLNDKVYHLLGIPSGDTGDSADIDGTGGSAGVDHSSTSKEAPQPAPIDTTFLYSPDFLSRARDDGPGTRPKRLTAAQMARKAVLSQIGGRARDLSGAMKVVAEQGYSGVHYTAASEEVRLIPSG